MLWRGGAFAARACRYQARRRDRGESRARRSLRAHRRRRRGRQDRRHSTVLHARIVGRAQGFSTTRPMLLADRVRCVGDRVAFVVAETEAQARDAAELVAVDYEPLPALVDLEQAANARGAENLGRLPERQYRRDHRIRRQGRDRRGVRQGQARRHGTPGQQSRHGQSDRAALRDRRLRRRRRQIHALHHVAGSAQRAHGAVVRSSFMCRSRRSGCCRPMSAAASA